MHLEHDGLSLHHSLPQPGIWLDWILLMTKFRILSLDGGGIRGAFGAALMAEFEQRLGEPIGDYFDLIAGTSTGAIIAASLASGIPADEIVEFYENYGPKIFSPREAHRPRGWVRPFYPIVKKVLKNRLDVGVDDFFRAKFCPFMLNDSFVAAFGDQTLGGISKSRLVVPTVDLTRGQTYVFRTPHLPIQHDDVHVMIKDVLVAATAAPTYFPHKVMSDGNAYADGGLFAANPSMIALAESMKIAQLCTRQSCDPRYDTSETHVLSIGTGVAKFSLAPPGADAGQLYWANKIARVMVASQTDGLELPLKFVLGDRYKRLNFDLPDATWTLDCIEHIPTLLERGRRLATDTFDGLLAEYFDTKTQPYRPFVVSPTG